MLNMYKVFRGRTFIGILSWKTCVDLVMQEDTYEWDFIPV